MKICWFSDKGINKFFVFTISHTDYGDIFLNFAVDCYMNHTYLEFNQQSITNLSPIKLTRVFGLAPYLGFIE